MNRSKDKRSRRPVTKCIVYKNHKRPHDPPRELKVDVPHEEIIDEDYAAAMVSVRTIIPLEKMKIVKITD